MELVPERVIRLEGAYNVRDLGGYPVAGGGETRWRSLLRADSLAGLMPSDRIMLAGLGVGTIIDLRGAHELAAEPNPFAAGPALRYLNIPLYDRMAPIADMPGEVDMAARYCAALDRCGDRIAEVLGAIGGAAPGAVLFHCTAGKDRTGIIAALLLTLCGVPREAVLDDYALTAVVAGPLLDKLRARALARGMAESQVELMLASDAAAMRAMLDRLDSVHGGIDAYLAAIGLSTASVEAIRRRLV